jgi:preprotein translocase subunit SecA
MFKDLEKKTNVEQAVQLKKLILVSFILHIYDIGVEPMKALSRLLLLEAFDRFWMEHLDTMTDLREGISLRNLAQRDPLVEYKNEGFRMFDDMLKKVDESIVTRFFKVRLVKREEQIPVRVNTDEDKRPGNVGKQKTIKKNKKVGRNDPCPCGSGKKYKKCCFPKYG